MNANSDNLNPDMAADVSRQPTPHALSIELTVEEVAAVLRSMGNSKAVGPDELPVELLRLRQTHNSRVLREVHQVATRLWHEKWIHRRQCDAIIEILYTKGKDIVRELQWYFPFGTRLRYSSK